MKLCFQYLSLLSTVLLLGACGSEPREILLGTWQVDSVYLYYNGFEQRQTMPGADWALHQYRPDGTVREIKFDTYRAFRYQIEEDRLYWRRPNGRTDGAYQILKLQPQRLVLKREKPPLFPGRRQERYEIRYFSRGEAPAETAITPFQAAH